MAVVTTAFKEHNRDAFNIMLRRSEHLNQFSQDFLAGRRLHSFDYTLLNSNGSALTLSTNKDYLTTYFQDDLCSKLYDEIETCYPYQGFHLIGARYDQRNPAKSYIELLKSCDLGHTLVVSKSYHLNDDDYIALFSFHGNTSNAEVYNYYLNATNEIELFCNDVHTNFLTDLNKNPSIKHQAYKKLPVLYPYRTKENVQLNPQKSHSIPTPSLTQRQLEIMYWYYKGKNARQTGEILKISTRTVEEHFANIRKTLGVKSKQQALLAIMNAHPYLLQKIF